MLCMFVQFILDFACYTCTQYKEQPGDHLSTTTFFEHVEEIIIEFSITL